MRRFKRDSNYYRDYVDFMNMMLDNDFMEKVPEDEMKTAPGQVWYLSHHGVYHKTKRKLEYFSTAHSDAWDSRSTTNFGKDRILQITY